MIFTDSNALHSLNAAERNSQYFDQPITMKFPLTKLKKYVKDNGLHELLPQQQGEKECPILPHSGTHAFHLLHI